MARKMRMPVSVVKEWPWSDLVVAVTDLVDEQTRCAGCGLSEQEAWWVKAEVHRCPTCADRDQRRKDIPTEHPEGWRVRFGSVADELGVRAESAAARQTPEGMLDRKRAIAEHRASQ